MQYVADLHLHSKYSRAVSRDMVLPTMAGWAKKKGIDILTTSDWTHPLWLREIRGQLEEAGEGLYTLKSQIEPLFLLSVEVSSIYSQGGKLRRIHNLIFSPSFATAEKIGKELARRGVNLMSDGRPIMGISARDLLELVLGVDPRVLMVPAHCLTPDSLIHTKEGMKEIRDIRIGDFVYTHRNRARRVTDIFCRPYEGNLYRIRPWYFSLGLATTPEHPFYALKVKKCSTKGGRCLPTASHKKICKKKHYENYKQGWIVAEKLEVGDALVFPRFQNTTLQETIPIDPGSSYGIENGRVFTGGTRGRVFSEKVQIDGDFCRLIGYYLAEGYTNSRDEIGFTFRENETAYVEDVATLMDHVFGISYHRTYRRRGSQSIEMSFYSKLLVQFFTKYFYVGLPYRATTKMIPDWMLHLPTELQAELLKGWWRGDGGYTSSVQLMNGMKVICLRLGIVPSILKDTKDGHLRRGKHQYRGRTIKASGDSYVFSHLAFFEDPYDLLSDEAFKNEIRKLTRKHGWIDNNYIYMPIRTIENIPYNGEVFNLEVEEDNSYIAEFATVHNCWTPWFSLFGSNSGFDSIDECFGNYAKYIYAIETGLSSDPEMNWRIRELENRSILSFSDAHSPAKMGREATVFELEEPSYENIRRAVMSKKVIATPSESRGKQSQDNKIIYTIEFYPEEGKYHYTGHRNCRVVQSPEETKQNGTTCPVCKRPLTVGVEHRVEQLAQQAQSAKLNPSASLRARAQSDDFVVRWFEDAAGKHPKFAKLVPLLEIIAEALSSTVFSGKVRDAFDRLTEAFGSEIAVLMTTDIASIERIGGPKVAEGVGKVRSGDIVIHPGYDGEYGKVRIWSEQQEESTSQVQVQQHEVQLGLEF